MRCSILVELTVIVFLGGGAWAQEGNSDFFIDTTKNAKSDFSIDYTEGHIRCNLDISELGRAAIHMAQTYEFELESASSTGFDDIESPIKCFTTNFIIPENKKLRIDAVDEIDQPLIINIHVESGALYAIEEITIELGRELGLLSRLPMPMENRVFEVD